MPLVVVSQMTEAFHAEVIRMMIPSRSRTGQSSNTAVGLDQPIMPLSDGTITVTKNSLQPWG